MGPTDPQVSKAENTKRNSLRVFGFRDLRIAKFFRVRAVFITLTATAIAGVILWLSNPPPISESKTFPQGFVLRDSSGDIIRVGLGPDDIDCRPTYVPNYDDWIVKAILAAEDCNFYKHHGVLFTAVLRAIRQNVTTFRNVSGASTITMQTVRLIKPHKRSFIDKICETIKAVRLEQTMSKDEILGQYLNRAPFGSNIVGIEAASQVWFGRKASDLSLAEASLLAGLPQAPSRFRPDRNLERALKRRSYVLDRMQTLGMISESERENAEKVKLNVHPNRRPFKYPWFSDWACIHENIEIGDIRSTLNPQIQSATESILSAANDDSGPTTYAAVILSVKDNSVLAMAATGDYFAHGDGQINAAVLPRLAGSTLKPLAFAMLADHGGLTPKMVLPDVPRTFGTYAPKNFSGTYHGLITAEEALVLSLNMPALDVVNRIGVKPFAEKLRALGFNTIETDTTGLGLGIILGSVSVRLVDLAAAYSCIARGGTINRLKACEFPDNKANSSEAKVFSEGACWMISEMLSGEERSLAALGHVADVKIPRFAWKTGTSAGFRDAWTVAWNPEYVVAVWCGNKHGHSKTENRTGLNSAAPVVWQIIRTLYPSGEAPWFNRPESVKERKVCTVSGQVASPLCPQTAVDTYIAGTTLWSPCSIHVREANGSIAVKWPTEIQNGLRALGKTGTAKEVTLRIVSPADGTRYRYFDGIDAAQTAVVKLAGVSAGESVYWFVNNRFHKTTTGTASLTLPLSRGTFIITASTESGASDQITVIVE